MGIPRKRVLILGSAFGGIAATLLITRQLTQQMKLSSWIRARILGWSSARRLECLGDYPQVWI